jgi:aspartyl protease
MKRVHLYIIKQKLWLIGLRGKVRAPVLFDTGATLSLIREDVARKIQDVDELAGRARRCIGATRTFMVRPGLVADVEISRHRLMANFCVTRELTEDVILGNDFMAMWSIILDPEHRRVLVDPECLRLRA